MVVVRGGSQQQRENTKNRYTSSGIGCPTQATNLTKHYKSLYICYTGLQSLSLPTTTTTTTTEAKAATSTIGTRGVEPRTSGLWFVVVVALELVLVLVRGGVFRRNKNPSRRQFSSFSTEHTSKHTRLTRQPTKHSSTRHAGKAGGFSKCSLTRGCRVKRSALCFPCHESDISILRGWGACPSSILAVATQGSYSSSSSSSPPLPAAAANSSCSPQLVSLCACSPHVQLLFTPSLKSAERRSSSQTLVRWPMKFLAAISNCITTPPLCFLKTAYIRF